MITHPRHRAQTAAHSEPPLHQIGRFLVRRLIGEGAQAQVYVADDPVMGRPVALKIPRLSLDSRGQHERFLREARAAARLRHPHLVAVYESGEIDDQLYIAGEFVDGRTLADVLAEERPGTRQAAEWVCRLADALSYAHSEGVVHRDVKPGNILVDEDGQPLLADFGMAKLTDDPSNMTTEGGIVGSPVYMSPEQARGDGQLVGPASDQYSLGIVLYELLAGHPPFEGPAHLVISRIVNEQAPSPRAGNRNIPRDLEVICLKCLEKDISKRYATCRELAEDLECWLEDRAISARRPRPWERLAKWCRKEPLQATLTGLAICILASSLVASVVYRAKLTADGRAINESLEMVEAELEREQHQARLAAAQELEFRRKLRDARKLADRVEAMEAETAGVQEQINEEDRLTSAALNDLAAQDRTLAGSSATGKSFVAWRAKVLQSLKQLPAAQRYRILLAIAHDVVRVGQYAEARVVLAECPEALRGWEWRYLMAGTKQGAVANAFFPVRPISIKGAIVPGSVRIRSDGDFIAIVTDSQIVMLATDRRATRRTLVPKNFDKVRERIRAAAFSPDLGRLAILSGTHVIAWDLESGDLVSQRSPPRGSIHNGKLAFSSDGKLLVVSGNPRTGIKPLVWDGISGNARFDLDDEPIEISPDAAWLTCQPADQAGSAALQVVDLTSGRKRFQDLLPARKSGISLDAQDCRFSADGHWLIWKAVSKNTATDVAGMINLMTGQNVDLPSGNLPRDVCPVGERLVNSAGIWQTNSNELVLPVSFPEQVWWSPDGKRLVAIDRTGLRLLNAPEKVDELADLPDQQNLTTADSVAPESGRSSHPVAPPERETGSEKPTKRSTVAVPALKTPFSEAEAQQAQQLLAIALNRKVIFTNSLGMTFRLIPGGEFVMEENPDQETQGEQKVRIRNPLYVGTNEVTVGQFRRFVDVTEYVTQAEAPPFRGAIRKRSSSTLGNDPTCNWRNPRFAQADDHPVVGVSWNDAVAFCSWLSDAENRPYRLPTEAEWEYSCRAGTTTLFHSGKTVGGNPVAANVADLELKLRSSGGNCHSWSDGFAFTAPVGRFPPNAFGLYDLHGNVAELCHNDLEASDFPAVIRGGSWSDAEFACRSANREVCDLNRGFDCVGFRVVFEVPGRALRTGQSSKSNVTGPSP